MGEWSNAFQDAFKIEGDGIGASVRYDRGGQITTSGYHFNATGAAIFDELSQGMQALREQIEAASSTDDILLPNSLSMDIAVRDGSAFKYETDFIAFATKFSEFCNQASQLVAAAAEKGLYPTAEASEVPFLIEVSNDRITPNVTGASFEGETTSGSAQDWGVSLLADQNSGHLIALLDLLAKQAIENPGLDFVAGSGNDLEARMKFDNEKAGQTSLIDVNGQPLNLNGSGWGIPTYMA